MCEGRNSERIIRPCQLITLDFGHNGPKLADRTRCYGKRDKNAKYLGRMELTCGMLYIHGRACL
jgi:hypothetical protein